jgi:hypothetical protein
LIVAVHVASGAVLGRLLRSRRAAVLSGLAAHGIADAIPHRDIESRSFEIACGVLGIVALSLWDGPLARTTLGALAAALPDVEHVLPLPRLGGRKLYPTHRFAGWHRSGGVGVHAQLICATAAFVAVRVSGRRPTPPSPGMS